MRDIGSPNQVSEERGGKESGKVRTGGLCSEMEMPVIDSRGGLICFPALRSLSVASCLLLSRRSFLPEWNRVSEKKAMGKREWGREGGSQSAERPRPSVQENVFGGRGAGGGRRGARCASRLVPLPLLMKSNW